LRKAILEWKPPANAKHQGSYNEEEKSPAALDKQDKKKKDKDKDKSKNKDKGKGKEEPEEQKQPPPEPERIEHDMLLELHLLFKAISGHKKNKGSFNHRKFILALKATNVLFDNDDHHDSHEFINWLLDQLHENYVKSTNPHLGPEHFGFGQAAEMPSAIGDLFRGELENIVTCVTCETTNKRKESFFNLSLDLEKSTSLVYCMQRFSTKELLNQDNKLHCDTCLSHQVATKEIIVSRYPKILLVHLKRFRIDP